MVAIYGILNTVNGKLYIGQSRNLENRWKSEKKTQGVNRHLKNAMKKYGIEKFCFFVIEECDLEDLNYREKFYIKLYHTFDPKFGYNKTSGGDTSFEYHPVVLTDEQRKKISDKAFIRWHNMPDEKRKEFSEKLRIVNLGKTLSEEHKRKIGKSQFGMKRKDGTGKNISEAKKKAYREKATRMIVCIETGEEFYTFEEAENCLRKKFPKVCKDGIKRCISGSQKSSGGLHFEIKKI